MGFSRFLCCFKVFDSVCFVLITYLFVLLFLGSSSLNNLFILIMIQYVFLNYFLKPMFLKVVSFCWFVC